MKLVTLLCTLNTCVVWAELSPAEIVRRATERESHNAQLRRQYTYRESIRERISKKSGKLRSDEHRVYEVFFIGGQDFRKLVEKDGRRLQEKDASKEQERMEKEIAKFKRESPSDAQKRIAKQKREEREFLDQLANGFDFRLVAEGPVSGRPCYRIHAEPKPGFSFKGDAKILGKMKGDIWIDKDQYYWARVEAETIDTVTAVAGLLRLAKGTTVQVGRTYVNNEVWFPDRIRVKANARAALFITAAVDLDLLFSGFKKYSVDSTVTVADEAAAQ